MKRSLIAAAALVGSMASGTVLAAGLNYNYVGLQYDSLSAQGGVSATGFGVDFSYDFSPNWGIVASYDNLSPNTAVSTVTATTVGAGYHRDMGGWDILGQVRYYGVSNNVGFSVSGYIASIGGRVAVSKQFELQGMVGTDYLSNSGGNASGTQIQLSGLYNINSQWGVYAKYLDESNIAFKASTISVGGRYSF